MSLKIIKHYLEDTSLNFKVGPWLPGNSQEFPGSPLRKEAL